MIQRRHLPTLIQCVLNFGYIPTTHLNKYKFKNSVVTKNYCNIILHCDVLSDASSYMACFVSHDTLFDVSVCCVLLHHDMPDIIVAVLMLFSCCHIVVCKLFSRDPIFKVYVDL